MSIVFNCTCGKKLQARDELAGKNLKCPSCHQLVPVPADPPLAQPVLAAISPSALPPLADVPAFPDEDDIPSHSAPRPVALPVNSRVDRSLDQQSTPWQDNDWERLRFREVPDFLFIFLAVLVVAGLTVGAFYLWPAVEGSPAVKAPRAGKADIQPRETASVTGKITYKGRPLNPGVIVLHSDVEELFPQKVQADGSYQFVNLIPGKYKVSLNSYRLQDQPAGGKGQPKTLSLPKFMPIPQKYTSPETSGLSLEIKAGKQTFNIELTD